MDCSLPAVSVHGIFQERILEWVALPSSRGSSQPRNRTCVSCVFCIAGEFSTHRVKKSGEVSCMSHASVLCSVVLDSVNSWTVELAGLLWCLLCLLCWQADSLLLVPFGKPGIYDQCICIGPSSFLCLGLMIELFKKRIFLIQEGVMGWWGYRWNTVGQELIHCWSSVMATWVFHYNYTLYFYMYLEVSPNNQFFNKKDYNKNNSTFSVHLPFFLWPMASFLQVSSLPQISVEQEGWLASLQPILPLCRIDGTSLSVLLPSLGGLVCPLVALSPVSHMPA